MTKFLIVGDLHGHMPNIHYKTFDAIIAPGDFCSDGVKGLMMQALRERLKNSDNKCSWYDYIGKEKAKMEIQKSLADGRKILEFLNSEAVPTYIVPGNWEWTGEKKEKWRYARLNHYTKIKKKLDHIIDVYHAAVDIGDYTIIGHGIHAGPEYPQYSQDRKRYSSSELRKLKSSYVKEKRALQKLFQDAKKPIIFLSHNVPYNTKLDKILNPSSPRNGQHFGSIIARELINEFQPLVCIGGHMHEHFTSCKVGKTLCINAGFGSNVNVLMELQKGRVTKLEFHGNSHKY